MTDGSYCRLSALQSRNWRNNGRKRRQRLQLAEEEAKILAISNLNQGKEAPFYAPDDALDPYPKKMPVTAP